jgi:phosphate:Na+ symporter
VTILGFIVHLLGGAMLLLFAVRFMRVGIERLWSEAIRSAMRQSSSKLSVLAKGTLLGTVMQGSTVVILMAAGLVGAGITPTISAVILSLGADFGSALAALVLTLPISEVSPLALLVGGWLYLNAAATRRRNLGRVILGLGLILLALALIREAVEPLKSYPGTFAIVSHLNSDPVSAAMVALGCRAYGGGLRLARGPERRRRPGLCVGL